MSKGFVGGLPVVQILQYMGMAGRLPEGTLKRPDHVKVALIERMEA
jgi:hypothetical protein